MDTIQRRSKEKIIELEVYTDGSLKRAGKSTYGAWGFIVVKDGHQIHAEHGVEHNTTNQRMELMALVKALAYLAEHRPPNERAVIYSDSAYIINCYQQEWYINWENNGWLTSSKKEVSNQDLWYHIVPYFDNFWYTFLKVPAHCGNYWNERCDELVQAEAEKLKREGRLTNEQRII